VSTDEPAVTIGFFDSGVGGVSVWREVRQRLPGCATLYVADSEHCPYGPRPPGQIRRFSRAITRFLLEHDAALVVVACNTASAAALQWLRARFDVPFVGMEPAVKPAAQQTRTGHIGVLATRGTVEGELFRNTSARHAGGVMLHVQVGEGLVECVESGQAESAETELMLRRYLEPMVQAGVDQIVLGCTHYPFLLPTMRRILPASVSVVDPAAAVARQVERLLIERPSLWCTPDFKSGMSGAEGDWHRFFTTGRPHVLSALLHRITGQAMRVERIAWRNGRLQIGGTAIPGECPNCGPLRKESEH